MNNPFPDPFAAVNQPPGYTSYSQQPQPQPGNNNLPWSQSQQQERWGQPQWNAQSQQQPYQNQQQYQQPQQQPQPQQPSWSNQQWSQFQPQVLNDPLINAGLQAGVQMAQNQANLAAQTFAPGVSSFWGSLKVKFNVTNSFVVKKISMLLFPYAKKEWHREATHLSPANDFNAPDLYIPTMALVTYVLAVGLVKGASMTFDPEVLVDAFGTSIMAQSFQVIILRGFFWALGPLAPIVSWLDLLAYTGYQFVGVALNMIVGVLLGPRWYMMSLGWTSLALGYVMFRTMGQVVPPPEPGQRGRRRRIYFLIATVVLQISIMVFLGYSTELRSLAAIRSTIETGRADTVVKKVKSSENTPVLDNGSEEAKQATGSPESVKPNDALDPARTKKKPSGRKNP